MIYSMDHQATEITVGGRVWLTLQTVRGLAQVDGEDAVGLLVVEKGAALPAPVQLVIVKAKDYERHLSDRLKAAIAGLPKKGPIP